jgi:hypothetical protein
MFTIADQVRALKLNDKSLHEKATECNISTIVANEPYTDRWKLRKRLSVVFIEMRYKHGWSTSSGSLEVSVGS